MSELIKTTKREKVNKSAMYHFSGEELLAKGKDISQQLSDLRQLENEKKAITSEYKAKIDAKQAEININSGHIQNGFCYRNYECYLVRNFDSGNREYYDVHTGELVTQEKLSPDDYQVKIDLEAREAGNQEE